MQIALDYYRILGLPLAATEEQLRQAYNDRILQLPQREYSTLAIAARKRILEQAYMVLSDPRERSKYDQAYLAYAYDQTKIEIPSELEGNGETANQSYNLQPLTIDVAKQNLVGALVLLQELGEYELVIRLGQPYLTNRVTGKSDRHFEKRALTNTDELPDVILTVALSCLELGREQWQQGNYENAAISLETGEELLLRERMFTSVQAEITADLCKLRPYRILDLLALPMERTKDRHQGWELLQNILDQRGGIDGVGNDQTGLNVDDFLRFIQQLRHHLTVSEQHKLFESESKRPSTVATYLLVYGLIAKGFCQSQPALIRQAKQVLLPLAKRQDVHLEQALCALLLGQTEEATRVLELSQDYEQLTIIRQQSQDSPDLLPGLCLYCEQWLEQEVFPHFRDLSKQQASLKDYFADKQVQAYLEQLPADPYTTEELRTVKRGIGSPHTSFTQDEHLPIVSSVATSSQDLDEWKEPKVEVASQTSTAHPQERAKQWKISGYGHNSHGFLPEEGTKESSKYKHRRRGSTSIQEEHREEKPSHNRLHNKYRQNFTRKFPAVTRLNIFFLIGGILGIWVLIPTIWGRLNSTMVDQPNLHGGKLVVQLNQPTVVIPQPAPPSGQLTKAIAQTLIETWLSTKAAAMGSNHEIKRLDKILIDPALSQWQSIVRQDMAIKRYRKYEHEVKIELVHQEGNTSNNAVVEATVKEITHFYRGENLQTSGREALRVRYDLTRQQKSWRIRNMTIVES
ncbi:ARC6/PARC6 family protein [Cylindrospermopsis raciborskii]|uniref:Molecular chaperone DnaJ n=1 Tax=Cylindrospermopsis raciborskii CENA302 TaxID=1170768 RepID=A0A9Q5W9C6_9CYAN|nr:ARC6/PARC6 family protein [Cylindrospermopsis raciborskii]OHY35217.1 molecular chaperone DnaJ [Cylindrospermopsis raciborskii MVCC14]OPH09701.1 molecular chaperone DnaJ [Cylindrospermopsis raciborskii CENA302]